MSNQHDTKPTISIQEDKDKHTHSHHHKKKHHHHHKKHHKKSSSSSSSSGSGSERVSSPREFKHYIHLLKGKSTPKTKARQRKT